MFYTFDQNNSGGYYIRNEMVDTFVIIEGDTEKEIIEKAKCIFEDYSEYCPCCGERWELDIKSCEFDDEPMVYDKPAKEFSDNFWKDGKIIIYYKNGTKEIIPIEKKNN